MAMTDALQWFSGKGAEKAKAAIEALQTSLAAGYWVTKGGGRSVRAALNKGNIATKFARANEKALENFGVPEGFDRYGYSEGKRGKNEQVATLARAGWEVQHCMYFGSFERAQSLDFDLMEKGARNAEEKGFVETARRYAQSFAEITAALAKLDATIPPPVFTELGVSPTITKTWEHLGAEKVTVCPIRYEERQKVNKEGKLITYFVPVLEWPEGTIFGAGRFPNAGNSNCQSCNHRIRNPFNWVPLVIHSKDGKKKALWTGRDCAESLFGIKMTGDLDLSEAR